MPLLSLFRASASKQPAKQPVQQPMQAAQTAEQALFKAVKDGNLAALTSALDTGIPVDSRNNFNETALMQAVSFHHVSLVQELLKRKADPNAAADDGLTPLCYAAQVGHWDLVRMLCSNGARPSSQNPKEFLLLNALLLRGEMEENVAQVTALEAAGVNDADTLRAKVFQYIDKDDADRLESCLQAGVPADLRDTRGNTLLMRASQAGSGKVIDVLTDFGVDINATNKAGDTALTIAQRKNDGATIMSLQAHGAKTTLALSKEAMQDALIKAVADGRTQVVDGLLKSGADPNDKTLKGETLLGLAAANKNYDIAAKLLNAGADPAKAGVPGVFFVGVAVVKSRDVDAVKRYLDSGAMAMNKGPGAFDQYNLLHVAAETNATIAKLVMENDPSLVNRKEKWGSTPLRVAMETKNLPMVQALLDAGASPGIHGKSPDTENITDADYAATQCPGPIADAVAMAQKKFDMMEAAGRGDVNALEQALAQGVPVDVTDGAGNTLLFYASRSGYTDIVKTLLRHGANASRESGDGKGSPISVAVINNRPDIVCLLGDAGASVTKPDSRGFAPITYLDIMTTTSEMKDAINYCRNLDIVRMSQEATRLESSTSVFKALKFRPRGAAAPA